MKEKKQIYEVLEERAFKELEEYEQMMLQKEPCEIYDASHKTVFRKAMLNYIMDKLPEHFEETEAESLRYEGPLLEEMFETWEAIIDEPVFSYQEMRTVVEVFIEERRTED